MSAVGRLFTRRHRPTQAGPAAIAMMAIGLVAIGLVAIGLALVLAGPLRAQPAPEGSLSTRDLRVGKETRRYLLYTPAGVTGPAPVVVALHGAMQTPQSFRAYFGLDAAARKHGFIVAYPEGEGRVWNDARPAAMRLKAMLRPGDDVPFLVLLARTLVSEGIADPARIYLTGISNGGFMVERMACEAPQPFAAFSAIMATAPADAREECRPGRAVPILFIHGTADSVIAYDGFWTPLGATLSAPDSAALFAKLNDCPAPPRRRSLPDLDRADGTTVREAAWEDCRDGSRVVLMSVERGGHTPPVRGVETKADLASPFLGLRNHDIDSGEEVWRFMSAFPAGAAAAPAVGQAGTGVAGGFPPNMPLPPPSPLRVSPPAQRGMSTQ